MKLLRDFRAILFLTAATLRRFAPMPVRALTLTTALALFVGSLAASRAATMTAWTFENDAIAVNNSPAPSTGTGTVTALGMNIYPLATPSTTTCDVLAGVTGDGSPANTTHEWRVRGTGGGNGWNSAAAIGAQGAQFAAGTVGYNTIIVTFDWNATTQGEGKLQVQYTTDGSTWNNVTAAALSSGADASVSVQNNTSSATTVIGGYFKATAQAWYPGLTATISDGAAANNPNFAVRLVNASTGADCVNTAGAALNNTSGNWRFDNVVISGTAIVAPPTITGAATASAFATTYGTASAAQTFPVSGANLTANLVATAPAGFEVSSDGATFGGTATFLQSGGNAGGTLTARLAATAAVSGSYDSQNIVLSSAGASSVNITTAASGNTVSAKALTITANDVSTPLGTPLSSPVTGSSAFTSSGLVNSDTISSVTITYGSHASATMAGSFPGEVTPSSASGSGLGNYSISYSAGTLNVTTTPTIITTGGPLHFGAVPVDGTSAEQTYTVAGQYLTAPIVITPPVNFEVSITSGSGFVANPATLQLAPSGGTVGSTTIYVHFKPTAQQVYSGANITHTTTGGNSPTAAVDGTGVTPPTVTSSAATSISASSATLNGNVTSDGGTPVLERGFCYKTTAGVTISDNRTPVSGTTGAFNNTPTLSVNQQYYFVAYATNAVDLTLSTEQNFWTLAKTPVAPVVGSPTATALNVSIGAGDGNPASTTYAIQETGSGKYVQGDGTLGTSAVFQTASTWGSVTVNNLMTGTFYTFEVEAQNGAGTDTAFGLPTTASTLALPYQAGAAFTPGNLAVLSPDNGGASETTFHILEISPTIPNSVAQSIAINGTTGNPGTALTMGTSGTSGGLSLSSDGTLLCFPGYNTTGTTGASTSQRGVGTLDSAGLFDLPATYQGNGPKGDQTRSVTTVDNQHFYWADKGGVYTNNATAPSDAQNVLRIKSFGGTVYVINQQGFASVVSIVSPDASKLYAIPGYPTATDANAKDFYLISSGMNGSTFDIIYQLDSTTATVGTIYKYSLMDGQWTANGSYTTPFGGSGICAARSGGGAALYVVTGLATAANNSIEKLTDSAGYNAPISITDNGTLYTAPGTTSFKGVEFAPVSYTVTYAGNGDDGGTVPVDNNVYGAGAPVTELGNGGNLTRTGYVFAGWNTALNGGGTNSLGGINFNIESNTTFYAQWAPVNSPVTNTVEITSTVTYTVDPAQPPFSTITSPGYQWYLGSTVLSGQTGASLTLNNVQFADSGSYSVVVSNSTSTDTGISQLVAVLTVVDTHPPVLSLPANITATTGTGGVQVTFNPTALDAGSGVVPVVSSPPSGSYFSPGVTLVNCFAKDNVGNTASGSFLVTVVDTDPSTNIVVNGRIYLPYSSNLAVGTWVWIDSDPANGSLMRATQRLLGEDEVTEKGIFFANVGFSQVTPTTTGNTVTYDYSAQSGKNTYTVGQLVNKYDPILIGPDGLAYITDGHHTMAAYLLPTSPVHDIIPHYHRVAFGQIIENLAGHGGTIDDTWWLARQAENNAYLYSSNGDQLIFPGEQDYATSQPVLPSLVPMPTTPSESTAGGNIPMVNDDGRSLGWGVRQGIIPSAYDSGGNPIVGYANTAPDGTAINFVDFFWADFFRDRVVWDNRLTPTGNGDANAINAPLSFFAASANGIALGKSELYRDQNGRGLFDYTNLATYAAYFTNANTVAWAQTAIGNGLAVAGDTYNMYLRDDSTIAGDIIPSAFSTNILHIDTVNGMIVTQLVENVKYLYVNMGAQLTTIFPDAFVPNSTLTFAAGTGEVQLNDTAYVSGVTVISNGICSVNGQLNSPVVTVANGGILQGVGTINGAVTVQSSATLAPGNSIGTLTVNGPLTLAGTTVMEISKIGAALTSDLVSGVSTVTFGGTLTVNASGDALVGGETFTLFSASHYMGTFPIINLPPLAAGLHWDLSRLAQNGTIRVLGVGPVANTAYYSRPANVSLQIFISDLLANVTDANGFTVSFVGVGTDGLDNLTTNHTTLLNYGDFIGYTNSVTPNVNDSFKYTVSDGHGSTATGMVVITMDNNLIGQNNVNLAVGPTSVTASFFGVPGYRYAVERSTNMTPGVGLGWVPISTNTAPADGLMQVIDTFSDLGITVPPIPSPAFYRLRYNP